MKTPLGSAHFLESGRVAFSYGIGACLELLDTPPRPGPAPEAPAVQQGEPKLFYSLCGACNLQLSSAAQAQVHHRSRSHLRRVRQLSTGEAPPPTSSAPPTTTLAPPPSPAPAGHLGSGLTCSIGTGSSLGGPLPALVRSPSLMMQSSLDMKPFLSFPMDSSSPTGGLFPNFHTMDPVQKAVINHTFGVSLPPKKKQVISCNICQLRFNSDSQAEAHYKGSKHAKKMKAQQDSGKTKIKMAAGQDSTSSPAATSPPSSSSSSSSSSCCLASGLADIPERIALPPSPEESSAPSPLSLPPLPLSLPPSPLVLSSLSSSSLSPCQPAGETLGAPHSPSLPSVATAPGLVMRGGAKPGSAPGALATPPAESEEEKAKKLLYCSLCKVAVNSLSQLEAHNTGSKHKTMLEARTGAGPIKAFPRPGARLKVVGGGASGPGLLKGSGLQNKTFHCQICDVHVNSEIQLKQHISSRRHKDRVAGKPMKPKYSPYNKQQRSSTTLAAKLALQKELVKPAITPTFLSSPFCPPSLPSISLHPRPNPSLFHPAPLPPSFLRAAPGPIRPSTQSILFAPY